MQLKQIVELLQKPFGGQALIDTIEDKEIYSELKKLNLNVDELKSANFRHEQKFLTNSEKLQKGRTF
jgi:hypothetical protein